MIGRIERVPLREVWPHEARDFTRWLEQNPDVLEQVVGFPIASVEREVSAGSFSADLLAEDGGGRRVIIENQLGRSDHDHLGKLLTYLVALDAAAAIWIVSDPRPEHVGAVAWLNESSEADVHLLKLEAIRIGESPPAPLLTLIVGPSPETKQVRKTKQEFSERHVLRQRFWTELLERATCRTRLHSGVTPSRDNWIGAGAGTQGLVYNYVIRQHDGHVELLIDRGPGREEENERIFDALRERSGEIQARLGEEPVMWDDVEGRRARKLVVRVTGGGYRDEERWPEVQERMIDAMVRLEAALRPHLAKLPI